MIKYPQSLEDIVAGGLCIGCGICQSIAGRDRVEMTMMEPGFLRPKVKAAPDDAAMREILDVCPGASIDGAMPKERADGVFMDPVYGPWVSITRGYAADDEIRFKAAAGGALTALGMYLLDTGKVDFVLHVAQSTDDPIRSYRKVSFDSAQILAGTGSRYCPVAPLEDVTELLDQGKRFAFMGKPCDVNAMRNLAKWDRRVDKLVPYMLTISCAGVPELNCTTDFLRRQGFEEAELEVMRYRGYGWPGRTYARTRDGREAEETYLTTWYKYGWKAQYRCKICPDHTGEQADVTSADDWPDGGTPKAEVRDGWSLIVSRTPQGEELVREAQSAGYMYLEPYDIYAMYDTQPHQTRKKQGIVARLAAMWLTGHALPRYRRIRVLRAALTAHPLFHLRNFLGARRRVRAGQNRETVP